MVKDLAKSCACGVLGLGENKLVILALKFAVDLIDLIEQNRRN